MMIKNKIFIFEFVSGGGFNQVDIPPSLICEGYGMLRSIIADFKLLDFEISTLVDNRISFLSNYLNADFIELVRSYDNYIKKFKKLVRETEYCFIIAPEFSTILFNLSKIVHDYNKKLLSVDLEGIKLGTSKIRTYKFFKANNLKTPRTYLIPDKNGKLDKDFIIQKFRKFHCPIVIKPDEGVGAESIYYLENEIQISDLFHDYNNKFVQERNYILQEYIEGEDLSVSLIGTSNKGDIIILSVNSQDINIKNSKSESKYFGGHTPVENSVHISEKIINIFKRLDLSNFNSYFGIDFIRKKDESIYFIEINPRLTTSYIGIRNVLNYNLIEYILNPGMKLPDLIGIGSIRHSIFSRLELSFKGNDSTKEMHEKLIPKLINEIPELITPPISFYHTEQNKTNQYSCLIATNETNFEFSKKRMTEIMISFKNLDFDLIK